MHGSIVQIGESAWGDLEACPSGRSSPLFNGLLQLTCFLLAEAERALVGSSQGLGSPGQGHEASFGVAADSEQEMSQLVRDDRAEHHGLAVLAAVGDRADAVDVDVSRRGKSAGRGHHAEAEDALRESAGLPSAYVQSSHARRTLARA